MKERSSHALNPLSVDAQFFWPCGRVRTGHGVACVATNVRNTDTRDAVEKKMKANEMLRMFVVVRSKSMYVFTMKYMVC